MVIDKVSTEILDYHNSKTFNWARLTNLIVVYNHFSSLFVTPLPPSPNQLYKLLVRVVFRFLEKFTTYKFNIEHSKLCWISDLTFEIKSYLSSLQLLNQTVARVMRTVLQTRPVSRRNVQTLAQERVKRTTSARLGIIWLPATNAMIRVSFYLCVWRIMNILFVSRNLTSSEWSNFKECFSVLDMFCR